MEDDTSPQSHLFTLRVWVEALGAGQEEWRAKIHHIPSGQIRYFRDWEALVGFLRTILGNPPLPGQGTIER